MCCYFKSLFGGRLGMVWLENYALAKFTWCVLLKPPKTPIQSKSAEVWHLVSPLTSFVCNGYFSCNKVITERHKCPRNFFQCLSISTSSQTFPSRVPRLISQIGNQQGGFVSRSQSTSYHLATYFHQKIPFFGAGPRGDPVSEMISLIFGFLCPAMQC